MPRSILTGSYKGIKRSSSTCRSRSGFLVSALGPSSSLFNFHVLLLSGLLLSSCPHQKGRGCQMAVSSTSSPAQQHYGLYYGSSRPGLWVTEYPKTSLPEVRCQQPLVLLVQGDYSTSHQ